jgi:phasin family protein
MSNNDSREQLVAASKSTVDALMSAAHTGFATTERLVALNFETIREVLDDGAQNARALLDTKTPQEVASLSGALANTAVDRAVSYSRSVFEIAGAAANELGGLFQSQCAELNKVVLDVGQNASKSSLFGTDLAQAAMKQATQLSDSYLTAVSSVLKAGGGIKEKR